MIEIPDGITLEEDLNDPVMQQIAASEKDWNAVSELLYAYYPDFVFGPSRDDCGKHVDDFFERVEAAWRPGMTHRQWFEAARDKVWRFAADGQEWSPTNEFNSILAELAKINEDLAALGERIRSCAKENERELLLIRSLRDNVYLWQREQRRNEELKQALRKTLIDFDRMREPLD